MGIDMIGFEELAKHPEENDTKNPDTKNPFEVDQVRNSICRNNIIYNISTEGNVFADIEDKDSWSEEYGKLYPDRNEVADCFYSLIDNIGSDFIPDADIMAIYEKEKQE